MTSTPSVDDGSPSDVPAALTPAADLALLQRLGPIGAGYVLERQKR